MRVYVTLDRCAFASEGRNSFALGSLVHCSVRLPGSSTGVYVSRDQLPTDLRPPPYTRRFGGRFIRPRPVKKNEKRAFRTRSGPPPRGVSSIPPAPVPPQQVDRKRPVDSAAYYLFIFFFYTHYRLRGKVFLFSKPCGHGSRHRFLSISMISVEFSSIRIVLRYIFTNILPFKRALRYYAKFV